MTILTIFRYLPSIYGPLFSSGLALRPCCEKRQASPEYSRTMCPGIEILSPRSKFMQFAIIVPGAPQGPPTCRGAGGTFRTCIHSWQLCRGWAAREMDHGDSPCITVEERWSSCVVCVASQGGGAYLKMLGPSRGRNSPPRHAATLKLFSLMTLQKLELESLRLYGVCIVIMAP